MKARFGNRKQSCVAALLPLVMAFVMCTPSAKQDACVVERIDSVTCRYVTATGRGTLCLRTTSDSTYEIQHEQNGTVLSSWRLDHDVYRFDCGDLTGDSIPEIIVGTIKPTHYHAESDKRLFVYHLYKGRHVRPLWLGSRVGDMLIDFRVERDSIPCGIHTWERTEGGDTIQRFYRLKGFGLKFQCDYQTCITHQKDY